MRVWRWDTQARKAHQQERVGGVCAGECQRRAGVHDLQDPKPQPPTSICQPATNRQPTNYQPSKLPEPSDQAPCIALCTVHHCGTHEHRWRPRC